HFFKASKHRYGSKRIHRDLRADGERVSERRVARIMRENRISARLRKPRKPLTTNSNHKLKPSPNLLQQAFHCITPNTVWLADITYVDTDEGWLYLAAVKECAFVRHWSEDNGACDPRNRRLVHSRSPGRTAVLPRAPDGSAPARASPRSDRPLRSRCAICQRGLSQDHPPRQAGAIHEPQGSVPR
ncbi:IS3 family transposase, partial [Palleronia caenipelagi]